MGLEGTRPYLTVPLRALSCRPRLQLKVLRQLVELQLTHSTEIKGKIDRAWGVVHNKHKKKELPDPPPLDPMDPNSMENLQFIPFGQDMRRTRFWIVDGPCTFPSPAPRICMYLGEH